MELFTSHTNPPALPGFYRQSAKSLRIDNDLHPLLHRSVYTCALFQTHRTTQRPPPSVVDAHSSWGSGASQRQVPHLGEARLSRLSKLTMAFSDRGLRGPPDQDRFTPCGLVCHQPSGKALGPVGTGQRDCPFLPLRLFTCFPLPGAAWPMGTEPESHFRVVSFPPAHSQVPGGLTLPAIALIQG